MLLSNIKKRYQKLWKRDSVTIIITHLPEDAYTNSLGEVVGNPTPIQSTSFGRIISNEVSDDSENIGDSQNIITLEVILEDIQITPKCKIEVLGVVYEVDTVLRKTSFAGRCFLGEVRAIKRVR